MPARLTIFKDKQSVASFELDGKLRIGRRSKDAYGNNEPGPYARVGDKIIIAETTQNKIARDQATIELTPAQNLIITNHSKTVPLVFDGRESLTYKDGPQQFELGVLLLMSYGMACRIEGEVESGSRDLQTLSWVTSPPGIPDTALPSLVDLEDESGRIQVAEVINWLRSAATVFHSARSTRDFFVQASQAVQTSLSLDYAKVLSREGDAWTTASAVPEDFEHSNRIVDEVYRQKRTVWQIPSKTGSSLENVEALVAAPILDRDGEVVAVLYGDRRSTHHKRFGVSEVEAMVVDVMATGVAAGIARLEQEKAALEARVRFEQFFSPQLARQLELEPGLLDGKEAEISVLFCDIRGFSRISRNIGAEQTMRWIGDVLEILSECVDRYEGVLVDYVGDELIAMWGAPELCENHAELACRAATDMVVQLPQIDEVWRERTGGSTKIGIGINSGTAFVGNSGSKRKFKYSPLGNTVNLASRVEGATKHVGVNTVMTGHTRASMSEHGAQRLDTRRICQVRVVNIPDPVDLFELAVNPADGWHSLQAKYEGALTDFDVGNFRKAVKALADLHSEFPDDHPTLRLLSRSVNALANGPDPEHPVWVLEAK